jgi:O-glycosyl hydrolase
MERAMNRSGRQFQAVYRAITATGLIVLFASAAWGGDYSFVINPAVRYQTMDNFGANDAWYLQQIGGWSETNKAHIADLLFSTNQGIGLSCWRFNLGAGKNHKTIRDRWRTVESFEVAPGKYDWTRQANERWFLRAAKAHGVRQFLATVYSPPLRLTRNGLSNLGSDTNSSTNLRPGAEEEFARYLTDILVHFRDNPDESERIEFDYILPVNEPQWDWQRGQEGNRASNTDLKRIYLALARQLKLAGLKTKILGPESGSIPDMYSLDQGAGEKWRADYGNYLNWICPDPELKAGFNHVISYHSYWSDQIPDQLVSHREQLGRAAAKYPDWKLWQSEYCVMEPGRDLSMDTALRVARIIHCDLTLANASAWQWWLAVAGEDYKSGLLYTDHKRMGDSEEIIESKTFWMLGNFSRFIRPGMVRVEVAGRQDIEGVMGSAYLAAGTGQLIVVFVNMTGKRQMVSTGLASQPADVNPVHKFATYLTSDRENLQLGMPVEITGSLALPPRSVLTLVGSLQ